MFETVEGMFSRIVALELALTALIKISGKGELIESEAMLRINSMEEFHKGDEVMASELEKSLEILAETRRAIEGLCYMDSD